MIRQVHTMKLWVLLLCYPLFSCVKGEVREAEGAMNNEEFTLALNICQAYRSKNVNFKGEYLDEIFHFDLHRRSCQGEVRKYSVDARFEGSGFEASASESYISEFETHNQGHLAGICTNIMKGERGRGPASGASTKIMFTPKDPRDHYRVKTVDGRIIGFRVNLDHSSPMVGVNTHTTVRQSCQKADAQAYSEWVQLLRMPD